MILNHLEYKFCDPSTEAFSRLKISKEDADEICILFNFTLKNST